MEGQAAPAAAESPGVGAQPTAGAGGTGSGQKRVRAGSFHTTHPHDTAAAGRELLEKLAQFISQLGGSLGEGWRCEVKMVTVSESGDSGTCNATYITPGGKRMRSRGEVAKFLGLEVPVGKGARGGAGGGNATATTAAAAAATPAGRQPSNAAAAAATAAGADGSPAAAAAAANGDAAGGADGDGGDDGISKADAYAAAVARAKQLDADGARLPFTLKNRVVVESLGAIDLRPAFNTPLSLLPPGYRAVYKDAAVGNFVSEIRVQQGASFPQFVVTLVPHAAALQEAQQRTAGGNSSSGGGGGPGGTAAAAAMHVPGLSDEPSQQQEQDQQDAGQEGSAAASRSFQLAMARNADQAWAQVAGLQEKAKLQVEAAAAAANAAANPDNGGGNGGGSGAASGAANLAAAAAAASGGGGSGAGGGGLVGQGSTDSAALDPIMAQLLAKAAPLGGCWGKAMFGFTDVEVLQLMEALPGAEATTAYQFVDERGGWEKEAQFLAKGRWARRSAMQAGAKKPAAGKQQRGQQQHAAAATAGGSGGGGGGSGTPSKKRPQAAAATGGAGGSSMAPPKRHK